MTVNSVEKYLELNYGANKKIDMNECYICDETKRQKIFLTYDPIQYPMMMLLPSYCPYLYIPNSII